MREITNHKCNPVNDQITITADDPGPDGASHEYEIRGPDTGQLGSPGWQMVWRLKFQTGPIGENGINGITNEALLAIVIDRLQGFEAGPLVTSENTRALNLCERALFWLHQRTRDRVKRGVEGTTAA